MIRLKQADLLLNEVTDPKAQENFQRIKEYFEAVKYQESRTVVPFGYMGAAAAGTPLEFFSGSPGNTTKFIIPKAAVVKELTVANNGVTTALFSVYRNNAVFFTVQLTSGRKLVLDGLAYEFFAEDELYIAVTTGAATDPLVTLFFAWR